MKRTFSLENTSDIEECRSALSQAIAHHEFVQKMEEQAWDKVEVALKNYKRSLRRAKIAKIKKWIVNAYQSLFRFTPRT